MAVMHSSSGFYQTSQKVKSGIYACCDCKDNETIIIDKDDETLPMCKVCKMPTYWYKV